MNKAQVEEKSFRIWNRLAVCLLIGILLLGLSLRLNGLDAKSLWQDEIFTAAIASTENSLSRVVSIPLHNTPLPKPPLYFLITHFFLYVGDNDFLLRFPALFFGVLGVALTYALGVRLFGKREGLSGAFLLCLTPFHIRYSQDARFYTLLLFLSLFSLYFLHRGIFDKERKWWTGFTLCNILNVYNHHLAFLVLLGEMVFVAGVWLEEALLTMSRPTLAKETTDLEKSATTFDKGVGLAFVASLATTALAYIPMLPHLLRGLSGRKGLGGAVTRGMSLTPSFLIQLLDTWGLGSRGAILVFLIPFLLGIIVSARAQRRQVWLAFCWLVVPFGVLFALPAKHGFRPRYVLFMLSLYLLFSARGLTAMGGAINARWPRGSLWPREVNLAVFLLVIALLSVPAVLAYYAEDRTNWRAAASLLARSISPGEVIASPGPFAQVVLPRYQESLGEVDFVMGGNEVFFAPDRDHQGGVWFVARQEEEMPARESELREAVPLFFKVIFEVDDRSAARGRALKIAPAMYKDLWVLYVREDLGPQAVIELYEEALEVVPPSTAFSVHVTLGDLYRAESDLEQAMVRYQEATILDPCAPGPHYGLALVYQAQGLWEQYMSEWQTYEELAGQYGAWGCDER